MPARVRDELVLMNHWTLPGYETMTFRGINAACMAVTMPRSNEWLLECSDGYGLEAPDFDDLVIRVVLEHSNKHAA